MSKAFKAPINTTRVYVMSLRNLLRSGIIPVLVSTRYHSPQSTPVTKVLSLHLRKEGRHQLDMNCPGSCSKTWQQRVERWACWRTGCGSN